MPEYLAPGVFIEETSFRQKTIEGVSTSTAAFVGPCRFGPVDGLPEMLSSFGDFERIYGSIDELDVGGTQVTNYLAHGVRAFFENGGRRCYVARAVHSVLESTANTAENRIPASGDHLGLRARHPGKAGNFSVTFSLRMTPNLLDVASPVPRLRSAEEYQVVWIDRLDGADGRLAYLHEAFNAVENVWTYELRDSGPGPYPMVSDIDPAQTTDIRIITADVEVGRMGDFLEPVQWPGLSLHGEHPNSIQQIFRPDGDRRTELFVPLIVEASGLETGAEVARRLLLASGANAGLGGTAIAFSLGGAVAGTLTLLLTDDAGNSATAAITPAMDADGVRAALEAASVVSAGSVSVTVIDTDTFEVTMDEALLVDIDSNTLQIPGSVASRVGTRYVIDTTAAGRFSLRTEGQATGSFASNVSPGRIDDALDAIVGRDNVNAFRDAADNLVVTLWGSFERELEILDNAELVDPSTLTPSSNPMPVVELEAIAAGGSFTVAGDPGTAIDLADLTIAAGSLQTVIQAAVGPDIFAGAEGSSLIVSIGPAVADPMDVTLALAIDDDTSLVAAAGSATPSLTIVEDSLLDAGASALASVRLQDGTDGFFPDPLGYSGSDSAVRKSGFGALTDLPDVSIVAAPGSTWDYRNRNDQARAIIGHLITHCERMRYRIAVVDSGPNQLPSDVMALRGEFDSTHAALYYPWITTFDAITQRPQHFPPSGYVAGIYARNDVLRGVHKAPANETIALAIGFETDVNTAQQELLNPAGVNCLRKLEQRGRRVWGARTMSSDGEWKYVNLRRYFAYLEASIDRSTQWAVFEPNGPLLWDNIRQTVVDFLMNEFANNRLLGTTPEEAFFVKCDRSTMTQNDLDNGRLVCLIGVSPLRPAEFVVFRIGQKTMDFTL